MEPIVNPWFIYLLSVADSFKILLMVFGVMGGLGVFISAFSASVLHQWDEDEFVLAMKWLKRFSIVAILCLLPAILIPSRQDLILIYVASKVTTATVDSTIVAGKNLKDELKKDIIDIIEAIQKEEK